MLFKIVLIISGIAVSLCALAFPVWIFGIPGTNNQYAQGWYMGLQVILIYPNALFLTYISYFLMQGKISERNRRRWQLAVTVIALISLGIAIVRLYAAFSLILSS